MITLTLSSKLDRYLYGVAQYILTIVVDMVYNKINKDYYDSISDKINKIDFLQPILKKRNVDPIDAIELAIQHLEIIEHPDKSQEIRINPNVFIFDTKTKLISFIKLLEFGGQGLNPYPLFRTVFEEIARDIRKYYAEYIATVVGGI